MHALQPNENRNIIDTIIDNEEDSWFEDEEIPQIALPEIIAPSSVRNDFESLESFSPNDKVAKTIPAFLFERRSKNIKLDHLESLRSKSKSYGDEFEYDLFDDYRLQSIKIAPFDLRSGNSTPSKHESLRILGQFISKNNLEDNILSVVIPPTRIHRRSKYFIGDFTRLLKEWSDFYKKAVAMDDETRINDVPYKVKYSLLCQIFELILQNLPEAHATDQTFDIITDFLLTNLNMIRPAPREKEVDRVETLE